MTPAAIRARLGVSQAGMARLMGGTSPMTVSKWETGERRPTEQAAELMRLLLWLHETHPDIYKSWTESGNVVGNNFVGPCATVNKT